MHTHIHTYIHRYIYTYTHTYIHTYIHTSIHRCTYIHIQTNVSAPGQTNAYVKLLINSRCLLAVTFCTLKALNDTYILQYHVSQCVPTQTTMSTRHIRRDLISPHHILLCSYNVRNVVDAFLALRTCDHLVRVL